MNTDRYTHEGNCLGWMHDRAHHASFAVTASGSNGHWFPLMHTTCIGEKMSVPSCDCVHDRFRSAQPACQLVVAKRHCTPLQPLEVANHALLFLHLAWEEMQAQDTRMSHANKCYILTLLLDHIESQCEFCITLQYGLCGLFVDTHPLSTGS